MRNDVGRAVIGRLLQAIADRRFTDSHVVASGGEASQAHDLVAYARRQKACAANAYRGFAGHDEFHSLTVLNLVAQTCGPEAIDAHGGAPFENVAHSHAMQNVIGDACCRLSHGLPLRVGVPPRRCTRGRSACG